MLGRDTYFTEAFVMAGYQNLTFRPSQAVDNSQAGEASIGNANDKGDAAYCHVPAGADTWMADETDEAALSYAQRMGSCKVAVRTALDGEASSVAAMMMRFVFDANGPTGFGLVNLESI
ncbi:hypothetical protein ACFL1X_03705 [Candidatus Hydrogenedentota bacterium]